MALTENANSLKNIINQANPNVLADALRLLAFGDILRGERTTLRKKAVAASAYQLATLNAIVLPDDAKANTIARAYGRAAGSATAGELTVVAYGATPTGGQIAIAPNGDIVVLATDLWTSVDVVYNPEKCDPVELTPLPVATSVATLPASVTTPGVVLLCEVEALVGGSIGSKIILVPGAGAPAAGQARLNLARTTVTFAAADAVTSCRVKLTTVSAIDADALLTALSTIG